MQCRINLPLLLCIFMSSLLQIYSEDVSTTSSPESGPGSVNKSDESLLMSADTQTNTPVNDSTEPVDGQDNVTEHLSNTERNNTDIPSTTVDSLIKPEKGVNESVGGSADNTTEITEKPKDNISEKTVDAITETPVNDTQEHNQDVGPVTVPGISTDSFQDNSSQTQDHSNTTQTEAPPLSQDDSWMDTFLGSHHFRGQYEYGGGLHMFDFIVDYVHPTSGSTLVATFHDQDGAILEMNGTSVDGSHVVFKLARMFSPGFLFQVNRPFELDGVLSTSTGHTVYNGTITEPVNSSFTWFQMNKGLGRVETGDAAGTRRAIIIIVPLSVAFLAILSTVAIICWASKHGYLRGRHKSYRLFTEGHVSYESEAETIHI